MSRRVQRGTFKRSCRRCGWAGTYSTASRGDYAKSRHSCQRWLVKAESKARGEARMAAVDRTPKPCLHKGAPHKHGEYVTYVWDACRCAPCRVASRTYETNRVRQQAYGRWDNLVDAEPVREHVLALMAAGMGLKRVAAAAGISNGSATKLIYGTYRKVDGPQRGCAGAGELVRGPCKRVRKETAEKLLAVEFTWAAGSRVDVADTARRLQALIALGWSGQKLGDRLGVLRSNMGPLIHGRGEVTATRASQVHALYLELAEQAPPEETHRDKIAASRARRMARENGWAPPLRIGGRVRAGTALPDAMADLAPVEDPDVTAYDEAAVLRVLEGDHSVLDGRRTTAERLEAIHRLHAQGVTDQDIGRRTGIHPDQVTRDRASLGLGPVPHPMTNPAYLQEQSA